MPDPAKLRDRLLGIAGALEWLPQTIARTSIGWTFVVSGWGKIHHLEDKVVPFFKSLGIPAPEIQAPLAAGTELACGALLLAGLASRVAALPLCVVMTVAIATAIWPPDHDVGKVLGSWELLSVAALLWIASRGGGPISLDCIATKVLCGGKGKK